MRTSHDVSLKSRTTLGLGGTCKAEIRVEERADLENLQAELDKLGLSVCVLGAGSNIFGLDGEHELCLLKVALKNAPQILEETRDTVLVRFEAGMMLPQLLAFCRRQGYSGLEGLAGIPGSVGGALAMNAGSFGCCVGDCLEACEIWADGKLLRLGKKDVDLAYRVFRPHGVEAWSVWFACSCDLRFKRSTPEDVAKALSETHARKKERQPLEARSAGCVFKNPENGPSAGILLDRAGFAGKRAGDVAFSEKHANFLVNLGDGMTEDALRLVQEARRAVLEKDGIRLEFEVRTLPWRSLDENA